MSKYKINPKALYSYSDDTEDLLRYFQRNKNYTFYIGYDSFVLLWEYAIDKRVIDSPLLLEIFK